MMVSGSSSEVRQALYAVNVVDHGCGAITPFHAIIYTCLILNLLFLLEFTTICSDLQNLFRVKIDYLDFIKEMNR